MVLGKGLSSLLPQSNRKTIHQETGVVDNQRIWQIPLSEITPNSEQPRRDFSHQALEDLVASIKEQGVIQPVVVTEKMDGGYELIVGERRFRAAQIAGLENIPAIVRSATAQQKLELALIENIQRQNLNPIEEAFAYQRLLDEFNLKQEEVAQKVGKARATIANLVRLLDLPDVVQKALADGALSVGQAKALLSLKSEKEQLEMFASMQGEKITVRDLAQKVSFKGPASLKGSVRRDPNLLAAEKLLEERLGTKVHITQKGTRGKIEIDYYSQEEFKRLLSDLT
jgi:ParB family chromosome partitioning protein